MAITRRGDMSRSSVAQGGASVNSVLSPYPAQHPAGPGGCSDNLGRVSATHLSPQAYERLQVELEDLTTRGRLEIARAIEAARALGDLSENGDYHAAKDSQGKMESRIRKIHSMLESAVLVEEPEEGVVGAGSVVSLRYSGEDEVERYLVGSIEERRDDVAVISPGSPLGKALIGRSEKDTVEYESPGGTMTVEIVGVGS